MEEFSKNIYRIFEDSSKLMTFPAKIAEFLNLDAWKQFETNVTTVLELGNQVMDQSMVEFSNGDGMLAIMLQHGMPADTAKRIILDLIIAAGDTVSGNLFNVLNYKEVVFQKRSGSIKDWALVYFSGRRHDRFTPAQSSHFSIYLHFNHF